MGFIKIDSRFIRINPNFAIILRFFKFKECLCSLLEAKIMRLVKIQAFAWGDFHILPFCSALDKIPHISLGHKSYIDYFANQSVKGAILKDLENLFNHFDENFKELA